MILLKTNKMNPMEAHLSTHVQFTELSWGQEKFCLLAIQLTTSFSWICPQITHLNIGLDEECQLYLNFVKYRFQKMKKNVYYVPYPLHFNPPLVYFLPHFSEQFIIKQTIYVLSKQGNVSLKSAVSNQERVYGTICLLEYVCSEIFLSENSKVSRVYGNLLMRSKALFYLSITGPLPWTELYSGHSTLWGWLF
jgi:hypothetical protein